ncbi:enoyl-CoA hydratase [Actinoalloteichus sp. AHMU CJ021]|uniref:Enoyl-CoA hydratase n=2 Tax=Actinoalloteichus cyanogriseus TaxID=2893586 RepID=A0ABT1JI07_ACTCY|nr:enoyl-CoA hydratase-related protein [Actinoalloteichus caeruleus]AUS78102.1 enoyl-CoA hydratase [Actinoalloteichus sp. AHMU CJ021]MCP2332103.1 enoyl-CoA hydratase [Actinoalloteichus caeruleus DSM 43889]
MGEFVTLEATAGVGTIRLHRPPLNALNRVLQRELRTAAEDASERSDVRAVVVYGGEKVFAAGADIKEMIDSGYAEALAGQRNLAAALDAVAAIPKPTVAAVTGYALGGGLELALCCDHRIAGDNVRVGLPEVLLGVIPGGGGTQRLARLVGPARAKDLIYTGRYVDATEAREMGLVDRVVGADEVHARAVEWAGQFATGPAVALAAAKAAIDGGLDGDLDSGLRLEGQLFAGLFTTEDQKTGMRSFVENGPGKAVFDGK